MVAVVTMTSCDGVVCVLYWCSLFVVKRVVVGWNSLAATN